MPTPPTSGISTLNFLNLAGGKSWTFKNGATDPSDPVKITRIQPYLNSDKKLRLEVSPRGILPDVVMEVKDVLLEGQLWPQYTWQQAIMPHFTFTWEGGLPLPVHWHIGQTITAKAQEGSPESGYPVQFSLTLKELHTIIAPIGLHFPPNTPLAAIKIEQTVRDIRLGKVLATGSLTFAEDIGLVAAKGQNYGKFYVLEIESWEWVH